MEIRDVEVMVLATPGDYGLMGDGGQSHGPRHSCVFLVHTDEDLTGISQVETQPHVAAAIVEAPGKASGFFSGLRALAIGQDPSTSTLCGIVCSRLLLLRAAWSCAPGHQRHRYRLLGSSRQGYGPSGVAAPRRPSS
jgi:hypothetical protein